MDFASFWDMCEILLRHFPPAVEKPDAPAPLGLCAARLTRLDPAGIALRARLQATLPAIGGSAAHIPLPLGLPP